MSSDAESMILPIVRVALQKMMTATAADEQEHRNWTYEAVRPMPVPAAPFVANVPRRGDCGKGAQYVAHWTPGAPDPMRNGWSEWGNSTTIFYALSTHIALSDAEPGDIVLFGHWNGEDHACMLYGTESGVWMVWNFGEQGQPYIGTLEQEILNHAGMVMTVCRLMPDPSPTPQELLQAKTGYWAWLGWYEGEGEQLWKPYGPRNMKVRPNVPAKIPAAWWAQRKKFLAARHKGNP
jgi:hypothetical protein